MSTVQFYCAICGAPNSHGADVARPLVQCAKCHHVVPAPDPVSFFEDEPLRVLPPGVFALEVVFGCDGCGCRMKIDARAEGRTVPCARCARETMVPYWSRRAPSLVALSAAEIDFLTESEAVVGNGRA